MNKELLDTYIDVDEHKFIMGDDTVSIITDYLATQGFVTDNETLNTFGLVHITSSGDVLPVSVIPEDRYELSISEGWNGYTHEVIHFIIDGEDWLIVEDETPRVIPEIIVSEEKMSAEEYVATLSEDPAEAPTMTKLDMFAIEAMKVIFKDVVKGTPYSDVASLSYIMADAMLVESEARNG